MRLSVIEPNKPHNGYVRDGVIQPVVTTGSPHPSSEPLYRSALALVANTGATSVLGLLFWVLAARRYSAEAVGGTAALISLFLLLANIAELNLSSALVRFLPTAGPGRRRFLLICYGTAASLGVGVALVALPFAHALALVRQLENLGTVGVVWMCTAVAVWCCFALQDAAAVALRGALWVPVENAVFGMAKIAALLAFASVSPTYGLLAAWTLPMAFMLLPVNGLIFRYLLPAEQRNERQQEELSGAQIRRFVILDYITGLTTTAAMALVPVVVVARLGEAAGGYFYVVWAVGSAFELALANVGSALVAEASRDQRRLRRLTSELTRRIFLFAAPLVVAVVFAAPLILRAFGPVYVRQGTTLLRLLGLAVLPRALIVLWMSVNRVRRLVGRVVAVQGALSAAMLAITTFLLGSGRGIEVVGIVLLGCQLTTALVLLPSFLGMLGVGRGEIGPRAWVAPAFRSAIGRLTALRPDAQSLRRAQGRAGSARPLLGGFRPLHLLRSNSVSDGASLALTGSALVVWLVSLSRVRLDKVGNYGFISSMSPLFFIASALLVGAFGVAIMRESPRTWLLAAQAVLLVFLLHGTVPLTEPLARFPTAWLHAGFTEYIGRTGLTMPRFDARFDWPGFFGLAALITRASGLSNPVSLLRFAPLVFNLAYLLPVYAIASAAARDTRVRWIAVWLFISTNWVGQDYFAPQAFTYFLAMVFIAILLRYFKLQPVNGNIDARRVGRWRRMVRNFSKYVPEEEMTDDLPLGRTRALLVAVVIGLFIIISVSHQLTGPLLIVAVCALVVARRCSLTTLPLVMLAIFGAWLSFGAFSFWSGHLGEIFGGFGRLGAVVDENVHNRLTGSASRLVVQHICMALTAALFAMAAVGVLRRWRRGRGDLALIVLVASPFTVLLGQSYGGEALLRAVFFATPFLAVLAAMAFIPAPGGLGRWSLSVFLVVAALLQPAFLVARYGNERWDMVTEDEHKALEYVYDTAPPGASLVSIVSEIPWGYRSLDEFMLLPRGERQVLSDPAVAENLLSRPSVKSYLIVTRGQVAFGELFAGLPSDWADRVVDSLIATGRFKVVYTNRDAKVIAGVADGSPGSTS